jgi:hypothetical protein
MIMPKQIEWKKNSFLNSLGLREISSKYMTTISSPNVYNFHELKMN